MIHDKKYNPKIRNLFSSLYIPLTYLFEISRIKLVATKSSILQQKIFQPNFFLSI